jgi:hypothetical protein
VPPRFAYWTIIAGGLPTAFRASEREDLQPTLRRIQEKHPDAVMRWFARGKLWESPEASRRDDTRAGNRAPRTGSRGRNWRPGGDHQDPRQPFKDAKRAKNQVLRQERFKRKTRNEGPGRGHEDAPVQPVPDPPGSGPKPARRSDGRPHRPPREHRPTSRGQRSGQPKPDRRGRR